MQQEEQNEPEVVQNEVMLVHLYRECVAVYSEEKLRSIFINLAQVLIQKKMDPDDWLFALFASTLEKKLNKFNYRRGYTLTEVITANYLLSIYGSGICRFLSANASFPERTTIQKRMNLIRNGIRKI